VPALLYHLVGEARGLLDPVPGRCAYVHADIARIHARKKVFTEHEDEAHRQHAEAEKRGGEHSAPLQQHAEQHDVAAAQALERRIEAPVQLVEGRLSTVLERFGVAFEQQ
jgi:F0F1-type ATP synthase membrane subunit b/b'